MTRFLRHPELKPRLPAMSPPSVMFKATSKQFATQFSYTKVVAMGKVSPLVAETFVIAADKVLREGEADFNFCG